MILIVDDIPANVYSLKSVLEANGFKVDSALSGEEALKKILVNNYVLVILDVQMPGMDGFEVAENMYGLERTKHTAVIFLSANSTDVKFIEKGYQHGAADYITKPVDASILVLRVKTLYSLYEAKIKNEQQQREIEELYAREKRLNRTLSKYTEKLVEAQRMAKMGNWEYDLKTRELVCEPAVHRLLNMDEGKSITLSSVIRNIPVQERSDIFSLWQKLLDKDVLEFIHRYNTAGGQKYLKQYCKLERISGEITRITGIIQDVTGEKEKEAEIMKAYQRYELVNLATNDLLWDWDNVTNQVECNNNISTIYGYRKEDVGLDIEWWQNIIHPADAQHLLDVFVKTAQVRKQNCSCEYRILCADGSYKEVFSQSYCMYNAEGKLQRIISAVKDISELNTTKRELHNTEFKLLQTIESIVEGFFACDKTWEVTYWNKRSEELLGIKREDAIGRNLWDLFPEAKTTKFHKNYTKCLNEQRPYSFEEYYFPVDKWYRVNVHPSGGGIAVYFEDITQELMKGLELNNALIQAEVINKATHDVIWEWNLKTSTVKVNKNFNKLFGYAPKKNILNFEWWETRIHPEERDKVTDSINHALRAGHDTWEFEYRFADSKGHYHFVRDRAIILRDEHANPSNVTGSMSSIQELKEIESKLHDIAYSNSHVIRKPLANILGLIELLNEEDVQAPKELITLIKDSSLELDDVIKNIANMARS